MYACEFFKNFTQQTSNWYGFFPVHVCQQILKSQHAELNTSVIYQFSFMWILKSDLGEHNEPCISYECLLCQSASDFLKSKVPENAELHT